MNRLIKVLPELAQQLRDGLTELSANDLALSVDQLDVVDRCRCRDPSCGIFYCLPKELWKGKRLRQVIPRVPCLFAIDVYDEQIACVEILDRPEITEMLDSLFPLAPLGTGEPGAAESGATES